MWNIGEGGTQYALILKRVIKEKTLKVALEAKRGDEGGESFWKAHMLSGQCNQSSHVMMLLIIIIIIILISSVITKNKSMLTMWTHC